MLWAPRRDALRQRSFRLAVILDGTLHSPTARRARRRVILRKDAHGNTRGAGMAERVKARARGQSPRRINPDVPPPNKREGTAARTAVTLLPRNNHSARDVTDQESQEPPDPYERLIIHGRVWPGGRSRQPFLRALPESPS